MKDYIKRNYNLSVSELKEFEDYSFFEWNKKIYYFFKTTRSQKEIEEILILTEESIAKGIAVMKPIRNIYNSYITKIDKNDYILLEAEKTNTEYSIIDIIKRQSNQVITRDYNMLDRSNWYDLWSKKMDYLEYQVHELGKKYPVILSSFNYFDALAENAISYVREAQKYKTPIKKVLSHKRIMYPNLNVNYDNPLSFVIDIEVRDISEFIKHMALENIDYALIDLKSYIEIVKPDIYSLSMLYARLLYPSYYFDAQEKIINENSDEKQIIKIIDQINSYEVFLKKAWELIRSYVPIEEIEWVLKL